MSDITYKKNPNSSHRWLIPLLLFLLIGSIAWYALTRDNISSNRQSASMVSSTSSSGAAFSNQLPLVASAAGNIVNSANLASGNTITMIGSFFTQPSSGMASSGSVTNSIIGQQVQLSDVLVNRVTGDKMFILSSNNTNFVYVALSDMINSGSAEQALQVKDGQRVSLTGAVKAMPSTDTISTSWKLTQVEVDIAAKYSYYIEASQVTILVDTSAAAQ